MTGASEALQQIEAVAGAVEQGVGLMDGQRQQFHQVADGAVVEALAPLPRLHDRQDKRPLPIVGQAGSVDSWPWWHRGSKTILTLINGLEEAFRGIQPPYPGVAIPRWADRGGAGADQRPWTPSTGPLVEPWKIRTIPPL